MIYDNWMAPMQMGKEQKDLTSQLKEGHTLKEEWYASSSHWQVVGYEQVNMETFSWGFGCNLETPSSPPNCGGFTFPGVEQVQG